MPAPAPEEIQLYGQVLNDIKLRLGQVKALLTFPTRDGLATINAHRLEYAALHIRTSIEFVVMASLVANRPEVEKVAAAFKSRGADEAAKVIKRLNPNYWPKPIEVIVSEDPARPWVLEPIMEGFIREGDWRAEWGYLSTLLHAANPYKVRPAAPQPEALIASAKRLGNLHDRVMRLMSYHQVTLVDQNVILTAMLSAMNEAWFTFKRTCVTIGVRIRELIPRRAPPRSTSLCIIGDGLTARARHIRQSQQSDEGRLSLPQKPVGPGSPRAWKVRFVRRLVNRLSRHFRDLLRRAGRPALVGALRWTPLKAV